MANTSGESSLIHDMSEGQVCLQSPNSTEGKSHIQISAQGVTVIWRKSGRGFHVEVRFKSINKGTHAVACISSICVVI